MNSCRTMNNASCQREELEIVRGGNAENRKTYRCGRSSIKPRIHHPYPGAQLCPASLRFSIETRTASIIAPSLKPRGPAVEENAAGGASLQG